MKFDTYDKFVTVDYKVEGKPVTLLDLLTTIYEFYQESLPVDQKQRYVDTIESNSYLSDLFEIGPNQYRLDLDY